MFVEYTVIQRFAPFTAVHPTLNRTCVYEYWNSCWMHFICCEKDWYPLPVVFLIWSMFYVWESWNKIRSYWNLIMLRFNQDFQQSEGDSLQETVLYNAQYRDLVRLVNCQREKLSVQQAELTKVWFSLMTCAVWQSQLAHFSHCVVLICAQKQAMGACFCPIIQMCSNGFLFSCLFLHLLNKYLVFLTNWLSGSRTTVQHC